MNNVSDNDRKLRAWAVELYQRGEFTDAASTICFARSEDKDAYIKWKMDTVRIAPPPSTEEAQFELFKREAGMLKEAGLLSAQFAHQARRRLGSAATDWLTAQGFKLDVTPPYKLR